MPAATHPRVLGAARAGAGDEPRLGKAKGAVQGDGFLGTRNEQGIFTLPPKNEMSRVIMVIYFTTKEFEQTSRKETNRKTRIVFGVPT